ncbi:MAG: hypothetical protein RLZZ206_2858, partial [Cyanobacteriota bacterium]
RPGLLLLGDAAHPMSPLRAQGLNMALRDALVAAERLLPLLCGEGGGGGDGLPSTDADLMGPGPLGSGQGDPHPAAASLIGANPVGTDKPAPHPPAPARAAEEPPQRREFEEQLDQALVAIAEARLPEIRAVQALQRQELGRGELLRRQAWLRRLLAATAPVSGPLLSRRWQAGQPTLRTGLPLPEGPP